MKKSVEKGEPFYFRTSCSLIKQGKFRQISLSDDLDKFHQTDLKKETDFSISLSWYINI
jgi:hypothetical protein